MFYFLLGRGKTKRGRKNNLHGGKSPLLKRLRFENLERRELLSITWTGNAHDGLWGNGQNWSGNVAPQAGDDLVFNTPDMSTVNFYDGRIVFAGFTLDSQNSDIALARYFPGIIGVEVTVS